MEAKNFVQDLRRNVEQLKAEGVEQIEVVNLLDYLESAERDLTSTEVLDVELYKAKLQTWVEDHKRSHNQSVEMFRSVITAGQNALRTAFLMNGGSAVAVLAFIGHLATNAESKVPLFAPSLAIFVTGVLVAAVASGVTYLSQWFYAADKAWAEKTGFVLNIAAIVLGISSYVVFAFGISEAYGVLAKFT
ncbi:MAG: hypothetical protein WCY11_05455 [Novosphingobium sp.]